jgi:hypothetical protein
MLCFGGGGKNVCTKELHEILYTNNVIRETQAFELYSGLKIGQILIVYFVGKFEVANLQGGLTKLRNQMLHVAHKCREMTITDVRDTEINYII